MSNSNVDIASSNENMVSFALATAQSKIQLKYATLSVKKRGEILIGKLINQFENESACDACVFPVRLKLAGARRLSHRDLC